MAVTALAMPAALMIPVAPAGQLGMKIAPVSPKDLAKPLEFNIPADAEPFHALMQTSSEADESLKAKPAKRNATRNSTEAASTANHSKERKPAVVWALPQIPSPSEPTRVPSATVAAPWVSESTSIPADQGAGAGGDSGISERAYPGSSRSVPDAVSVVFAGIPKTASPNPTSHDFSTTLAQISVPVGIQAVAQILPHPLSRTSSLAKPTGSPAQVAKTASGPANVKAPDDAMPSPSITSATPYAVPDARTAEISMAASIQTGTPVQVFAPVTGSADHIPQPMFVAARQESTQADSGIAYSAAATTVTQKQKDSGPEQRDRQTRVTTAVGPVTTISESTPGIALPPRSEPTPHTERALHNVAAAHREPAIYAEPTPSAAKLAALPMAPKQPQAASDLTSVVTTARSDAPAAFVPNMVPASALGEAPTAEVSFEARLRPMPLAQSDAPKIDVAPRGPQQQATSAEADRESSHASPVTPAGAFPDKHGDNQRDRQEDQSKTSFSGASARTAAEVVPHLETDLSPVTNVMPAAGGPYSPAAPAALTHVAAPAPSHAVAAGVEAAPVANQGAVPAAANDIKIALNDNGQRVELRVTQRAGDIHVTVRTPDSQLATAMREELPALSSRLEQSGFHSEMWRPAAPSSGESRAVEISNGNPSYDSREHHGGRQGQEDPQQNHRNPQQTLIRKSDRKEFSWLLESIR